MVRGACPVSLLRLGKIGRCDILIDSDKFLAIFEIQVARSLAISILTQKELDTKSRTSSFQQFDDILHAFAFKVRSIHLRLHSLEHILHVFETFIDGSLFPCYRCQ